MAKTLILGATGNIGRLVGASLAQNHPQVAVRLGSSRESGCASLRTVHSEAEVVQADWYQPDSLVRAMDGVDRVLMVTPDFVTDESVATPNVIRAAKQAGSIRQIVRLIAIPPGLTADRLEQRFLDTRCGANLHVVARPLLDASGLPLTYVNVPGWIMFNLPWFLAAEVKASRRLAMPQVTDADRLWTSEFDIADVIAKILADPVDQHVGTEHVLSGTARYRYADIARLLSDELGEKVVYADDDAPLKAAMGEAYDTLMTYFEHETRAYAEVPITGTVGRLLGRPQETVQDYLKRQRAQFL